MEKSNEKKKEKYRRKKEGDRGGTAEGEGEMGKRRLMGKMHIHNVK